MSDVSVKWAWGLDLPVKEKIIVLAMARLEPDDFSDFEVSFDVISSMTGMKKKEVMKELFFLHNIAIQIQFVGKWTLRVRLNRYREDAVKIIKS